MFLKSLDIYGFKSFAEKVSINFSGGISSIIGPNGCGKSNIIDAVRWTLGEQSAKNLRGGKMEDIIFSGSDKRKPLNFAEVTLTFSNVDKRINLDYDEISITRRVYRSGESEYLINKNACRLKDVIEMFMDTGIGKEVYSIVGQNRVEEIITARPEERRELIEEAAGILKYKHRKKEARKRLEDMRGNLQRITDLIYEMENQVKPLEGQAEIARQYRDLKENIKNNEEIILKHRISFNEKKIGKVKAKLDSLKDESFKVINMINSATEKLDKIKEEIDKLNTEREKLEKTLNTYMRNKEQLEGNKRLSEEKENNLHKQIKENINTVSSLKEQKEKKLEAIKKNEEEINSKEANIVDIEMLIGELKEKETALNQNDSLQLTEKTQKELTTETAEYMVLDSGLRSAEKEIDSINDNLRRYEGQLEGDEAKLRDVELKFSELNKNKESKELKLKGLEAELSKLAEEMQDITESILSLQEKRVSVGENLNANKNKLWLIEKLKEEKDPLKSASDELLKADNNLEGIICSFFSVLDVPEKYLSAVETALGEKYFGVIASDNKAAISALRHLQETEKGRTTIFPVESIKKISDKSYESINDSAIKNIKGYIDRAINLVKVDPSYRFMLDAFLGNVFICEDLSSAVEVAESLSYGIYVVTLQGEAVYPNGIIRGGKESKERLARWNKEKEVSELKPVLINLEAEKRQVDEKLENLKAREKEKIKKQTDIKRLEEQLKKEIDLIIRDIYANEKDKQHIEKGISDVGLLKKQALKELKDKEVQLSELREKAEKKKSYKEILSGKLESLKEKNNSLLKEKENNLEEINQKQIELNILKEQISNLSLQKEQYEESLNDINKSIADIENRNSEMNETLKQVVEEKNDKVVAIEELAAESRENNVAFEKIKALQLKAEARKTELEKEEQDIKAKRNRIERSEHRLELDITRLEAEKKHQIDLFIDKFGEAPKSWEVPAEFNESEVTERIEKLKEEVDNMGHVRVGAIEELERLNNRVNFLKGQEEDLKKGEASLLEILDEIDQRIKEQFLTAAEEIKNNFAESFSEIFGGGNAIIKFTDEEKILESGIDIDVQPPGKNLKNITLLSSGEKALTAIALVFAIFKYKPAPFYFLDEIESSLDDSNLTRFLDFLGKSAIDSQFILITHRRKTMEKSGLVYGVTMPEPGVSKIVSIKLDQQAS